MADPRSYSDRDVQAIIQRAIEQQGGTKADLTHADLLGIADQVGISAQALERAAHEVLEGRRVDEATQRVTSSRRRWLAAHAAAFAVVNALLFTVNALSTPGEWWFLFSAVFWGLALAGHAAFALGAGVSRQRQQRERTRIEATARAHPQLRVTPEEPNAHPTHDAATAPSEGHGTEKQQQPR